jgi:hypothetical protein
MSRTYRKQIRTGLPYRETQGKRPKQALQAEIDENLKEIRSPLYKWEKEREQNAT